MPNSPRSPLLRGPSSANVTVNGVARSQSNRGTSGTSRSSRETVKRPSPNTSFLNTNPDVSDDANEEDARAENISIIEELREKMRKAEAASEEHQRQLNMLQTRLDDSLFQQGKLEDQVAEVTGTMEELENDRSRELRLKREMESNFDAERAAFVRDKNEQKAKEEELELVIQRLKENLAQRDLRSGADDANGLSRSPTFRSKSSPDILSDQFAPPSTLSRIDSKNNTNLPNPKDKIIESLRLELAEAQIKNMEENMGGGRIHELEKTLLETRITNARLMEDNESFQLLLSEKTLSGDFVKTDLMHERGRLGSLAEELESAEGESDNYRRLEIEAKSLKDQNKALTLYIENIIGRLLQHSEFENILDKTPDLMSGVPRPTSTNVDKELPPPPPVKDEEPPTSILQRAKSVVSGTGRRSRPVSLVPLPSIPTEEPAKAPSVPLSRSQSAQGSGGHRRSHSDLSYAAPLVNQMYRGPSATSAGGPMMSPGLPPSGFGSRNSYVGPATTNHSSSRTPSASRIGPEKPGSSSNSTFSDYSGEVGTPSPPRNNAVPNNYTGAVMTQSKLRPLRLVQENQDMEGGAQGARPGKLDDAETAARKKANRSSWLPGWINRGKSEDGPRSVSAGNADT